MVARYPLNPRNPTRRALGDYGALTLEKAREKARGWLELIERGIGRRASQGLRGPQAEQRLRDGGGPVHRASRQRTGLCRS
ncbi:MAG: DUF4102 domain-containing protein [Rhodospirillales bacterium]|nr:DUF4102 domain-containing protein [Rhodospirillales bacterium]